MSFRSFTLAALVATTVLSAKPPVPGFTTLPSGL